MRKEMGLSSAASCSGFSDRENGKKLYIYIQVWGGWAGTVLPPWREFTTRPWADVHSDSLSDQVPVEVIGNLLIGTRRWDRWPRNHVVCWATVSCCVLGGDWVHWCWARVEMGGLWMPIRVHLVHGWLRFAAGKSTGVSDAGRGRWSVGAPLWGHVTSLGEEVVERVTQVGDVMLVEGPVLLLCLP